MLHAEQKQQNLFRQNGAMMLSYLGYKKYV